MQNQKPLSIAIGQALLLMGLTAALPAQAQAIRITNLHVLGDSLSDGGTYSNVPPVASGGALPSNIRYRFTNNRSDGKSLIWAEVLARELGIGLTPNRINPALNGGSNYAEGGSRVSAVQGINYAPASGITTTPLTTQVDRLLAAKPQLGANDLVMLWIGANDAFVQLDRVVAQPSALADASSAMAAEADKAVQQVQRLRAAGAPYVVVVTLPALDKTPLGRVIQAPSATALARLGEAFNSALNTSAPAAGALLVDANKLMADVIANPTRYGFNANVFGATACGLNPTPSGADNYFNPSLSCLGNNPNNYVFADGVHPSTQAHEVVGRYALGSLRAISQVAALAVGPMASVRQHAQSLQGRLDPGALQTGSGSLRPVGDLQVFGGTDAGSLRTDGQPLGPGLDVTERKVSIGMDRMVAPNMLLGAMISSASSGTAFAQNTGSFKTTNTWGTLYATLAMTPQWYINAMGTSGSVQHDAFIRRIELPVNALLATSAPTGRAESFRVGTGWYGQMGGFKGGPSLSLAQENVRIHAFTENDSPASMGFGATELSATRVSLGMSLMADGGLAQWRPFVRANIDRDLKKEALRIRLGPTADTLTAVNVPRPLPRNWNLQAGIVRGDRNGGVWTLGAGVGGWGSDTSTGAIGLSYRLSF